MVSEAFLGAEMLEYGPLRKLAIALGVEVRLAFSSHSSFSASGPFLD